MSAHFFNFSAGPAVLPAPVLKQAQAELVSYPGARMSVMEMSHRSKAFEAIIGKAEANVRALLGVPADYSILFLQGGASLQFSMIPMNFLRGSGQAADYLITGSWGKKAIKEAKREGDVKVVWDAADGQYVRVPQPSEMRLNPQAAYLHFTSNETIEGVQFAEEPRAGAVPLVCDASSDIFSRPLDITKYALIYAGAQKNIGPAGVTMVILRNDLLARVPANLPAMLDYKLMAENKSLYNTPPTFGIYFVMLVTDWLQHTVGGLANMAAQNREKAKLLYDAIDASGGYYRGHAETTSRSMMNVTWRMANESLEKQFLDDAKAHGLVELKGHRSVGGLRASIYNAMPVDGVTALRDFMREFQKKNG